MATSVGTGVGAALAAVSVGISPTTKKAVHHFAVLERMSLQMSLGTSSHLCLSRREMRII
jgi:hypothetical protein